MPGLKEKRALIRKVIEKEFPLFSNPPYGRKKEMEELRRKLYKALSARPIEELRRRAGLEESPRTSQEKSG